MLFWTLFIDRDNTNRTSVPKNDFRCYPWTNDAWCHRNTNYNLIIVLEAVWLSFHVKEAFFPCCSSRSHNSNCTFASRARLQHGGHFGEHSAQYQISVNCVNSEGSRWTLRLCLGQLTPWMTLLLGFTNFWAIYQQILGSIYSQILSQKDFCFHRHHKGFYVLCFSFDSSWLVDPTRFWYVLSLMPVFAGLHTQVCLPEVSGSCLLSARPVCIFFHGDWRRNGSRQLSPSLPYVVLANDINHCLVFPCSISVPLTHALAKQKAFEDLSYLVSL